MSDCKECIYRRIKTTRIVNRWKEMGNGDIMTWKEGVQMDVCTLNLRMTRPECPLFDDGKDVRE